jgi:hypothetical protein
MSLMELNELLKRIVTDDIGIENEDKPIFIVLFNNFFSKFKWSCCTSCLLLFGVSHFNFVLLLKLLESSKILADLEVEVEDYFFDSQFFKSLDLKSHVLQSDAQA